MKNEPARRIQGAEVLREAVQFLSQMRFSTIRGDFAEGDHVAILIDPVVDKRMETSPS